MMNMLLGFCVAIILCLSLLGWGKLLSVATLGTAKGDWPFQVGWGLCALAILGGFLNVTALVSAPLVISILIAGCVLWALMSGRALLANWQLPALEPQDRIAIAVLAAVACAIIVSSVAPSPWNAADDSVAYGAFPVKMLETGQVIEPFSFRRISGFGGYQFLQCFIVALRGPSSLQLFDKGLLMAMAGVAIATYVRRRLGGSWWLGCGAGILYMILPTGRINLSPVSIMAFLTLTLVETAQVAAEAKAAPLWRRAILLAVLCAGFLSVRANVLAVEGALLGLLIAMQKPFSLRPAALLEKATVLAMVGVFTALLLVPWAVSLYRSSGTPFFPVIAGNWTGVVPTSAHFATGPFLKFLASNIWYSRVLIVVAATLIGMAVGAVPVEIGCLSAAVAVVTLATIASMTAFDDYDLWRYYSPFVRLGAILVAVCLLVHWQSWIPAFFRQSRFAGAILVCMIAAYRPAVGVAKKVRNELRPEKPLTAAEQADAATGKGFAGLAGAYDTARPFAATYEAALAAIPKGKKVMAAVDAPFLLDYRDHNIVNIDSVGAVSPAPGLPLGKAPEYLANYLTGLSIDYLICVKPDNSPGIYGRAYWENPGMKAAVVEQPAIKSSIENFLWLCDAVDGLEAKYPSIFDSNGVEVLYLGPAAKTAGAASSASISSR